MKEPTIESVRKELRAAIFWTGFHAEAAKIEGNASRETTCRQGTCGFVEFGVNSGLLTVEEGNEWLDGIWRREGKAVGLVWMKYDPAEAESAPGADLTEED